MINSYLYKNRNELLDKVSSGGAFVRVCENFLFGFEKYSIYGATWDDNLSVVHSRIISLKDIWMLTGSKYVRSKMGNVFSQVIDDLLEGRRVVFSGTPCQIEGLKNVLRSKGIDKTNLLLVDIICHGTPSPQIFNEWKRYLEHKYNNKISSIVFRDKSQGWKNYPTTVYFQNGKKLSKTYDTQQYIRLFFSSLIMSPSCYECVFSNMNRKSDITIGDFWGVENEFPGINTQKGISLVIVNTPKGNDVVSSMESNLEKDEILQECRESSFIQYQHNLKKPTARPELRELFWSDYLTRGYNYILKKYGFDNSKDRMKFFIKKILRVCNLYKKEF